MKKLLLPLLIVMLFASCKTYQVFMGMSEQQFKKEHRYAQQVELSSYRTVYRDPYYNNTFYYFKEGKMYLMDQGVVPLGTTVQVPSR